MKLGLYLDLRNPASHGVDWARHYAHALDLCAEADAWGADSVWLSEHHGFADGYLPQPLTFAAAIAARTSRMRIGTAILLAPLRHPAHIAEEAAVVDLLSSGRLDLGLGAGYRRAEFDLFGADHDRPLGQLFSVAAQVRDLLESGAVTPAPAQRPLPLWLGCNGPKGARRAGAAGTHLLSADPALAEHFAAGRSDAGLDPAAGVMSGPVNIFLTEDPERDSAVVARSVAYLWDSYNLAAVEGTDEAPRRPVDMAGPLARGLSAGNAGLLVATPEQAAAAIAERFGDTPVETIFSWSMLPGVPTDLMHRHNELWSTTLREAIASV
jgi:alkanesulfonate monooxygenase SsuD/methylene tetrahydromethanopterin reductase-like flavin-dependent oxidoreductase (luciferase family)